MNKYVTIAAALIILSIFSGIAASSMQGSGAVIGTQIGVPPMPVVKQTSYNFTKIEISPRFGNLRLQPGESKEITVTIKNKETTVVNVTPNVVIPPYSQNTLEKEWVAVTPGNAGIPAGESQKFTIKISVPEDATAGFYNAQIAFTDEVIPAPYPQPVPAYVNSFSLSLNIWTPPKIQIMTPYIRDLLEAGKEYDYEINLKNIGDKPISISPKVGTNNNYVVPYPMTPQAFTDDAINITSPQSVPAGTTETVKIHVKVPADARGSYNGWIDLGIDDPSIQEFQGYIRLPEGLTPRNPRVEEIAQFAKKMGVHPVSLAVAWAKAHPGVTCPIVGARDVKQLQPSLDALILLVWLYHEEVKHKIKDFI